jgi:hypothetical protein
LDLTSTVIHDLSRPVVVRLDTSSQLEKTMLAFIDESGCVHPNDPSSVSVLLAVCMDEKNHRDVSRQLYRLQKGILGAGDWPELKATDILNRRTFQRKPQKWQLVENVFGLICDLQITMFAIVVPRPQQPLNSPEGHLPAPHRFLLQRINALAERIDHEAILVYDGNGMNVQGIALSSCINRYLFRVAEYNEILCRVVDTPLFVDSRITPGIQIADLAVSVVRQYEQNGLSVRMPPGDLYAYAIARLYRYVKTKTRDDLCDDRGNSLYGFYKMRREQLYREEVEDTDAQTAAGDETKEKGGPTEAEPPVCQ